MGATATSNGISGNKEDNKKPQKNPAPLEVARKIARDLTKYCRRNEVESFSTYSDKDGSVVYTSHLRGHSRRK